MQKSKNSRLFAKTTITFFTTVLLVCGCTKTQYPYNPQDPLQKMNRATFAFNKKVDTYAYKPVAKGYKAITPEPVRNHITNVFSNIGELPTMVNDALQVKPTLTATSLSRFLINSTFGVLGIFDVATHMGLEKHYNDFGITLANWGVTSSPYLVIPFLGPSDIRDGIALFPDFTYFSIWPYMDDFTTSGVRNGLFVLDLVNLRASLLTSEDIAKEASIDEYVFIRNAYLQKRASLIKKYTGRTVPGTATTASGDPLDELDGTDLDPLDADENADMSATTTTPGPETATPEENPVDPSGENAKKVSLIPSLPASPSELSQDNLMLALVLTDFNELMVSPSIQKSSKSADSDVG